MPEVLTETKESDLLDLDKRIALALGFRPTITWAIFNADETALMIDFEREAEAIKWWDEHPSVHAEHHIGELEQYEPYSTNIEAAMRVVEKIVSELPDNSVMRNIGFARLRIYQYADGTWKVSFTKRGGSPSTTADTLPEAICRAALNLLR